MKKLYNFIIIENPAQRKFVVGLLLPKKDNFKNLETGLLNKIKKSKYKDIHKALRINFNEKNNYVLYDCNEKNSNDNFYCDKKFIIKIKNISNNNNKNNHNIGSNNGNLININEKNNNFINKINNINCKDKYNFINNNMIYIENNQKNDNFKNQKKNSTYFFPKKGLKNIGSTCYMNATLQCLLHTSELVLYFLNEYPNDYKKLMNKNKNVESHGEISQAFSNLVQGVCKKNPKFIYSINSNSCRTDDEINRSLFSSNIFSPNDFKRTLGFHNSQFRKFEANDSKDLILYLFQTIHEELNYFGNNPPLRLNFPNQYDRVNAFKYFLNTYNYHNFSIISSIFYGTYENTTLCSKCNKTIYNFQKFEFISFGMYNYHKKNFNLYQGFEDIRKPQKLTGDNKFYCNNCHGLKDAQITSKIIQPPNKLLINIDYGKNKKFHPSKVYFDEKIDITNYVNFNFGIKIEYQIICVCTHLGSSGSYGHYIAYCRHRENGKWYKFNDSSCNECNKEEINRGSPYLLLYERIWKTN